MKKPCSNCEDFTPGKIVSMDQDHICPECRKVVRGPLMIHREDESVDNTEEHF